MNDLFNHIKSLTFIVLSLNMTAVYAHSEAHHLAKKLTNPVANLISIPMEFNYLNHLNCDDSGHQSYLKIEPVIPIEINPDWNIISRTQFPIYDQVNVKLNSGTQFGLSNTLQSFFLSPEQPVGDGFFWGIGPIISIPTATQAILGSQVWGLGPTFSVLEMIGPWTVGVLAYHYWSISHGINEDQENISYAQPYIAYVTEDAWTYNLDYEPTYHWGTGLLSGSLNASITKVFKLGCIHISSGGALSYWPAPPDVDAKGWGFRYTFTMMFPHKHLN